MSKRPNNVVRLTPNLVAKGLKRPPGRWLYVPSSFARPDQSEPGCTETGARNCQEEEGEVLSSTLKPFACPNCHVPIPHGLIQEHFLNEKGSTAHAEPDTILTRPKGSDEADNDVVIPHVHLNGTSRGELLKQLAEAQEALVQAIAAMGRATPHGRDYSVIDDDAITRAHNAHHARILKLEGVLAELQQIQEGVAMQQAWQ